MENVPGLAMMYGGKTVDRIYDQVRRLGEYEITGPIRINAADFGVPQNRERIVFVGNRRDMSQISGFPVFKNRTVTVREAKRPCVFATVGESSRLPSGLRRRNCVSRREPHRQMV
jgi:DNA (cytosine-5)-methyltransferase 1